ncbi:penicillin-binding protein 1C [Flavobacterium sp. SE-s28]|uniref:peptidoglycan glycosyltransferase n=1 Tax=Flavobacterium silvaticum TaxID=1852020 RepID=A0A972JFA6_9FLAO|nr:penicillin-binding protein 1C [Flavobacterium silvaticum]
MALIAYYLCLPETLFDEPYSTVIESREGELLGAKIASDGQWRFPAADSISAKYAQCVVMYEDENFRRHPGFNPISMYKAFVQNRKAGKVIRGGSTITQQVIRLSRKNKQRTYFEKLIEIILATRLELRMSKDEILQTYAAHAPFGGNVVGLEMASWRYFGVPSHQLSWAQNATLAVLPNAPGLIFPGRNQEPLKRKRDALLKKLFQKGCIDKMSYELALVEPLPQKPFNLPQTAPHLLSRVSKEHDGKRIQTTVDLALQERLNQIARTYYNQFRQNEVYNLSIMVIDVKTRNIVGYVGNSPTDKDHKKDVDIITAPRSTGSILKPLLFASMLDEGEILPNSLVADIPVQISGFMPQNFDMTYDGAVPAQKALSRSLNIPAVLMLQQHGVNKFYETLQHFKLRDINKHPDHYGLSLILGGAESNLWDLCRTYANLSSTLSYFTCNDAKYRNHEFSELNYIDGLKPDFGKDSFEKPIVGAGAIWLTFNAMKEVNRPQGDEAWKFYDSSVEIAWKTGTSFGNRDAWAIGVNSNYVVGVWVGNASGEGRPELTGVNCAAPVLFDAFNLLPKKKWFAAPLNDLEQVEVCAESGFLALDDCPKVKQYVSIKGKNSKTCPYHKLVQLDLSGNFRVNSNCEEVSQMISQNWFVLPPVMEYYYKSSHVDYRPLPPLRKDCSGTEKARMDFIYPKTLTPKIYLTKDFRGKIQPLIVKVAHSDSNAVLFWYVDDVFKGKTQTFHEMQLAVSSGKHVITVVDDKGNEVRRNLEIIRE